MQSIKERIRWIFLFITIASAVTVLGGCGGVGGGGSSSSEMGSISGTVDGTIVVAVSADNERTWSVEAEGESGNKSFSLDIPLNETVSLYLLTDGGTYPMLFSNDTKDAFTLTSSSIPLVLGYIPVNSVTNTATPTTEPSGANVPANVAKRSTIPYAVSDASIVKKAILGRSVEDLIEGGKGAARNVWAAGAYANFEQAYIRANGQSSLNKTRVLYALSRIVAMAMDTRYDGTASDYNRVGDFLHTFNCDNDTNPDIAEFDCSGVDSTTTYGGDNVNTFMGGTMATEFKAALDTLNEIKDTTFATTWAMVDVDTEGKRVGEWIDTANLGYIDSGELGSKNTWDSGPVLQASASIVKFDYSDVLILKAWLQYNLAQVSINQAYNLGVSFYQADGLTSEQFLTNNPDVGKLSSTANTHLATAKSYMSEAVDNISAAIDSAQAESVSSPDYNLFTIDASEVASTKQILADFKTSLTTATLFPDSGGSDQITLNLSKFFDGLDLRALIPPFTGDEVSGLFPDATMGGVIVSGVNSNEDLNNNNIPDVLE